MGWASGEPIIFDVWEAVREYIPEEKRVEVIGKVMKSFFDHDWDTEDDFIDTYPEAQEAMRQLYPRRYVWND